MHAHALAIGATSILGVGGAAQVTPFGLNAPYAVAGDSYLATGYFNGSDSQQGYSEILYQVPAMEYLGNPLRMTFKGNKAVGGTVVSQIQATLTAMLATMPTAGLIILDGGVNDESASTPAATINAIWDAMVAQVLADPLGHRLLILPGQPLQTPWGDGRDAIRTAVNAHLVGLAGPRVKVFNADGLSWVTGDYADKLHLNSQGSERYAAGFQAFMATTGWLPVGSTTGVAGTVYVTNPTLAGGTTAPTGGWSSSTTNAGGATCTFSKVAGKWRVAITGNYTGTGKYVQLIQVGSSAGFPAGGDFVEGLASYTIVGTPQNLLTVSVICEAYSAGFANTLCFGGSGSAFDQVVSVRPAGTYVTKTPQMKIDSVAAAAFIGAEVHINLPDAAGSTAVNITIDFDYIACRKCV